MPAARRTRGAMISSCGFLATRIIERRSGSIGRKTIEVEAGSGFGTASIESELLKRFDELIGKQGYTNRSEAIRDLVRDALVEEEWVHEGEKVAAIVTLVYDHHIPDLANRLTDLQHHHPGLVVAATHIHL